MQKVASTIYKKQVFLCLSLDNVIMYTLLKGVGFDMKKILVLIFTFVLSASMAFANSSIVIENSNQKNILQRIMKNLVKQGSTLENVSDYSFTAYNVDTSLLFKVLFGSHPETRYMITAIQDGKNVILSLGMKSTINTGGALQENIYSYQYQETELLIAIKKALLGYYSYGFEGKKTRQGYKITSVCYDKSKVYEKLSVGDLIISIDKQPVKGMSKSDLSYRLSPVKNNEIVKLTVRDAETKIVKDIEIKSYFVKPTI